MDTLKITQKNSFVIYVPLVVLNSWGEEPINPALITELTTSVKMPFGEPITIAPSVVSNFVILQFDKNLKVGKYDATISFKYEGRDVAKNIKDLFEIVEYDRQSNWRDYIVGDHVELCTQAFIAGSFLTDEDYERLKAEYAAKIAEAEAARDEWQRKTAEIEGVAKEQTLTSKSSEILTAISKGGGNPSKTAYEAMKRLQPYLYSIEYSELDYEGARDYFATHFVPVNGACTALRKGNQLGRNYDWKYNNEVEFLVRTKAHNGRFASIGIAGSISALTTDTIGEYSDEFKWMPFRMLDGMNEKGLTANVNMLNHDEERSLPQEGTTPLIEERERICSAILVRYILDNFATPQEACEYIRNYVAVYPPYHDGATTDLHFAVSSIEQLYYLCFEPDSNGVFRTEFVDVKNQPLPFVMTNFRMWNAQGIFDTTTGYYDRFKNPDYSRVEKYGMGIERANLCLDFVRDTETEQSVLSFMCNDLAYTWAYELDDAHAWLTEFVGQYSQENLARNSAATDFDRILGIVRQRYQERSRETALTWQTVHSVVYDLDTLTMQLVTQEGSVEDTLTFDPFKALPATKEDVENIDLSDVAKQGDNPQATNTAILAAVGEIPIPTDYAKEATLQEIKTLIGYTIQEIDAV